MIGIIGYGYVGKAVSNSFNCEQIICDPKYNDNTIQDLISREPEAIFVCVPTPSNDEKFVILRGVLEALKIYTGVTIVKSTSLPEVLLPYNVVYNPEFLTHTSACNDFSNPHMLVLSGERADEALKLYNKYSDVDTDKIHITSIQNACMVKYMMNCFFAVKVCYMNEMYDICSQAGADYDQVTSIVSSHPWMGSHHYDVPGHDGMRGFGGACLPKDILMMAYKYNNEMLRNIIESNNNRRNKS
jgi:nucleotide sugar dehydrogenase